VGKLLWHSLGAKTIELIHKNVHVGKVADDLEEYILDADVIDDISKSGDSKKLVNILKGRLRGHGEPIFKELSERLEQLRDKAEKGLIKSIEFVKELCKLAKETVEAEKEKATKEEQQNAKAALTELFIETKTDQTPAVVERIVNDIDGIVKHVRFAGWQDSKEGERVVARSLRKALLKYQLHKDQALFDRAYAYIKEYY
jgi:type I restriction enzyme R subunit